MCASPSGFLKIYRRFFSSSLWLEERELSRAEAWLDLLNIVEFIRSSKFIRGKVITVEVGETIASGRYLAERWRWSHKRVRNFLKELEEAHQITQRKAQGENIITITKYKYYNPEAETKGTPTGTEKGTGRAQAGHTEFSTDKRTSGLKSSTYNGLNQFSQVKDKEEKERTKEKEETEKENLEKLGDGTCVPDSLNFLWSILGEDFQMSEFATKWQEWCEYKKCRRLRQDAPQTLRTLAKSFTKWGVGQTLKNIDYSMSVGWQNIYEAKEDKQGEPFTLEEFRYALQIQYREAFYQDFGNEELIEAYKQTDLQTIKDNYSEYYNTILRAWNNYKTELKKKVKEHFNSD